MSLSDDDDDLFNNPDAIQALYAAEEHAASQAARPASQSKYHHTVSEPKVRPLNTEPRVSNGGFGWGDGGKHFGSKQMERIVVASKQQTYRDESPEVGETNYDGAAARRKALQGDEPLAKPKQLPRQNVNAEAGPSTNLQTELWKAKGEVETMRRTQKQEQARLAKETEQLKRQLADMEQKLRDKDKETARQLESLKTQAVFNNHAVYNSAAKKQVLDVSPKRKGKAAAFRGLVNAFDTPEVKPRLPSTPPRPLQPEELYDVEDDTEFLHTLNKQMSADSDQSMFFRIVTANDNPEYQAACSELLRAAADASTNTTAVLGRLLEALRQSTAEKTRIALLEFLAEMSLLYPQTSRMFEASSIGTWCRDHLNNASEAEADAIGTLCIAMCHGCDGRLLWKGSELVDIILSSSKEIDLFEAASQNSTHFRNVIGPSQHLEKSQPVIDRMSRLLLRTDTPARRITDSFAQLVRADDDAPLLLGEKSCLIPATVIYLHRISSAVWGIGSGGSIQDILSAITLLHQLVYPSTSEVGINLGARLYSAAQTREFSGVHHIFQAAVGRMAYAPLEGSPVGLQNIQDFSQDLMDVTLEGPEGDAIYSMYVADPEVDEDYLMEM